MGSDSPSSGHGWGHAAEDAYVDDVADCMSERQHVRGDGHRELRRREAVASLAAYELLFESCLTGK